MNDVQQSIELPPDNASRIAAFDAMYEIGESIGSSHGPISTDQLFRRVIGRLRILVPRELHLTGERQYFDEKVQVCIDAGLVRRVGDGLLLTGQKPLIRYPDGDVREYHAGLQPARERLEHDDAKLRRSNFDVRDFVPSIADSKDSEDLQALVDSMREHGYLKQFPIQRGADGEIVDGRARVAAAAIVDAPVPEIRDRLPQRLDTPLQRLLLVLAVNHSRMTDEDRERVRAIVSERTGRPWSEIESDLTTTRAWRRSTPRAYTPFFEVRKVRFRPGEQPNVQVTKDPRDPKVMLRSLLEAAGLSNYKTALLRGYVVEEEARTKFSANRKAIFVGIADAISGIERMQRDRRSRKLKLDPQWETIKRWLAEHNRPQPARAGIADDGASLELDVVEQSA